MTQQFHPANKLRDNLVEQELQKALADIGPILPTFCVESQLWMFQNPNYPVVDYYGATSEEVCMEYPRILGEWIAERLAGNIPDFIQKITPGRGGYRKGAGRPSGSKKAPTARISLPQDIADWLRDKPENLEKLKALKAAQG